MTLPSFLIIGAMKAGSTSLFRWLGAHPGVALPADKEPAFFANDRLWQLGLERYETVFPILQRDQRITGEASVVYSDPSVSERAARRAYAVLPKLRLLFLAREPAERLRSHYRHQVQRGREKEPLLEALRKKDQPYVRCSQYRRALAPWLDYFPREQLLTLRFESLVRPDAEEWLEVLSFLDLPTISRPTAAHNVTSEKRVFSPLMRRLFEAGAAKYEHLVPKRVRRSLKPLLFRNDPRNEVLLASSREGLPADVTAELDHDYQAFERDVGWGRRQAV